MKKIIIALTLIATIGCKSNEKRFDATGTFEATEIIVSSEANGKILEFDIEEGDFVKAGEQIGIIDTIQLSLKAREIESKLKGVGIRKPDIEKQIAALNKQLQTAQRELKRAINLISANAGNQKTADDIEAQIDIITAQIEAQKSTLNKNNIGANADIESLQYQLMSINDMIEKSKISSPQTGTILIKYTEEGEISSVGKPIFKIADLELIYLRAYITSDQLNDIKLGNEVEITTDNSKTYKGKVTWISEKSEFTPKGILTKDERANLVYAIKIAVVNDGYLKIGQYGEVTL